MSADKIASLQIEIDSNSQSASNGLQALTTTLEKLKTATKGGMGLTAVSKQLESVKTAVIGLNGSSTSGLAKAVLLLRNLGNVKISTNVANQLNKINEVLPKLDVGDGATKIQDLVSALKPLETLGKSSLSTTVNALKKLPEAMEKIDTRKLYTQIQSLTRIMKPLADEMDKIARGFSAFPSRIQKLIASTDKLPSVNNKASMSFVNLYANLKMATSAVKKIGSTIGKNIKKFNEYVENMNLFTVSMGQYAEEAKAYMNEVSKLTGIDTSEWARAQGVFMTLSTGFGVVGDRAYTMSQQLTQLGYDISSFYNISVEDAMQRLQSGISGELEPLRRLGYDLSQAKLEAVALSLGIDKSVKSMTQAEKAELRYYAIMTQVTTVQGDLARTIDSPANQLRILKSQFEQCSRAIGSIFIPMLNKVLPYVNAFFQIVRAIADVIAKLVGFTFPEVDYSGVTSGAGDIAEGFDSATESAKKLQKYTMGFDELNVIDTSSGSEDAASGLGTGFDFELPTYDFLEGLQESKVGQIVDDMKEWLGITDEIDTWSELMDTRFGSIVTSVGAVAAGLLLWKVSTSFISAITTLKTLLTSPSYTIAIGLTLSVMGITMEISGIKDAVANGLNGFNFGEILGGGLFTVGGTATLGMGIGKFIATAFKGSAVANAITAGGGAISTGLIGASIGGLIAGIPMFVMGIYDAIKNGLDLLSGLLIPAGATMSGAAIGAIIGMLGGPIGAGIGALIGLAVGLVTDLIILIVQNWESISAWFSDVFTSIGEFCSKCWDGIVAVWNTVSEWFDTWVIQPVTKFFTSLWENIKELALSCWNAIVEFFSPAIEWFGSLFGSIWQTIKDVFYNIGVIASGCWDIIVVAWGIASGWFNETVIQPIAEFFSGLWEGIKTFASTCWNGIVVVWNGVVGWFDEKIISPISEKFSSFWETLSGWASDCWEGIKSVFGKVGEFFSETFTKAWEGIVGVFSIAGDIFNDIKDGVVKAFSTVVNGLITGINKVVKIPFDAINDVLKWLRDLDILGIQPFKGIRTISIPQIPKIEMKAEGGFVDKGQMFIAREAGAEMVGSIGRKTAVANNDQIVQGIAAGVSVANSESNALLREQNSLLLRLLEKETGIYLDGKDISNSVDKYKRERGRTIVTGGAY